MLYQIDNLTLDTGRRELTRGGEPIKLTKLSFKVLEVLAQSAPDLVSYAEMIDRVWGENRVVSPENLSQRVMMLRQSLGDDASEPRYIEAVRGQGLRLVAEVKRVSHADSTSNITVEGIAADSDNSPVDTRADSAAAASEPANSPVKTWLTSLTACALVLLAVTLWYNNSSGYNRQPTSSPQRTSSSVAVLPFANLSPNPDNSFYAAGIHEEVLNRLAQIAGLRVISRTSMLRFEDTRESIPQIAEQLEVDSLVEGSVRYANDRIRVTVQLVDGDSDEHHWSQTYDRELKDIFQVESEIARDVAAALHQVVDAGGGREHRASPTENLPAYQAYMRGRQAIINRDAGNLEKAVGYFTQATELDPEFALAWVGLADANALLATYTEATLAGSFAVRQDAIDRALELQPGLAEAWLSLADLERNKGNLDDAEKYFLRSLEFNPNSAQAQHWYGLFLVQFRGDPEKALPYLRYAVALDPGPAPSGSLGQALWALGRVEEALAIDQRLLTASPELLQLAAPRYSLRMASIGRLDESLYWAAVAANAPSPSVSARFRQCEALLTLGEVAELEHCQQTLVNDFPQVPQFQYWTEYYVYRGELELLLERLQELNTSDAQQGDMGALAYAHLLNSNLAEAQSLFTDMLPQYFGDDEIEVPVWELRPALACAIILRLNGNTERADYIFDKVLEKTKVLHRIRGWGFGMSDIVVHVARDDRGKAKAALRDAIDQGWRHQWWELRGPLYQNINEDPEWRALYAELEADVARQRANYYTHKDDHDYWRRNF
jgi:TolB-like protein/DNA-binding winged helix-turn-helix (wHTH) protein/Tfp pilus assembly protein PilF